MYLKQMISYQKEDPIDHQILQRQQFYEQINQNMIFTASVKDHNKIILSLNFKIDKNTIQTVQGVVEKNIQGNQIQQFLLDDMSSFFRTYFVDKTQKFRVCPLKKEVSFEYNVKLGKPYSGNITIPFHKSEEISMESRLLKIERFYEVMLKKQQKKIERISQQLKFMSDIDQMIEINLEESDIDSLLLQGVFKRKLVTKINKNQEWSKLVLIVKNFWKIQNSLAPFNEDSNDQVGHISLEIRQQKTEKKKKIKDLKNRFKTAYIKIKQVGSTDYLQIFNNNEAFCNKVPIESMDFQKVYLMVEQGGSFSLQGGKNSFVLKCPVQLTIGLKMENKSLQIRLQKCRKVVD